LPTDWEYRQAGCDVVQIASLCNHAAGHGWDFVAVVDAHFDGAQVHEKAGDESSRLVPAVRKCAVLFRRSSGFVA
jgi:hypothetical protein